MSERTDAVVEGLGYLVEEVESGLNRRPTAAELLSLLAYGLSTLRDRLADVDMARLKSLEAAYSASAERSAIDETAELNDASWEEAVALVHEDPLGPLRRGEIDALVARLSRDAPPDIVVGPVLLREPRVLAVANDHPLATHDSVSSEVVADYAVADVEGLPVGMRDAVSPSTTPSGRPIRRALTVRSVPEVLAAVARGDIVHPTTASLSDYVNHPGVTFVALHDAEPISTALLRRSGEGDPRTAAFAAVAEETATPQVEDP